MQILRSWNLRIAGRTTMGAHGNAFPEALVGQTLLLLHFVKHGHGVDNFEGLAVVDHGPGLVLHRVSRERFSPGSSTMRCMRGPIHKENCSAQNLHRDQES